MFRHHLAGPMIQNVTPGELHLAYSVPDWCSEVLSQAVSAVGWVVGLAERAVAVEERV
jgi:hypothetical protein